MGRALQEADLSAVVASCQHEAVLPVVQVQALLGEGLAPFPTEDAQAETGRGGAVRNEAQARLSGPFLPALRGLRDSLPRLPTAGASLLDGAPLKGTKARLHRAGV